MGVTCTTSFTWQDFCYPWVAGPAACRRHVLYNLGTSTPQYIGDDRNLEWWEMLYLVVFLFIPCCRSFHSKYRYSWATTAIDTVEVAANMSKWVTRQRRGMSHVTTDLLQTPTTLTFAIVVSLSMTTGYTSDKASRFRNRSFRVMCHVPGLRAMA